jgi:hypothetical protein
VRIPSLAVLAVLAALALCAPAFGQASTAWNQFRGNPQGTSQASVVGAQSARPVPGFPTPLPFGGPGAEGYAPGGIAVSAGNLSFVAQGVTLSAYSPSGKRFWTYSAANANAPLGSAQPSVVGPALSKSGSTVYALVVPINIFVSTSSTLIALNAATGTLRWSAPVGVLAAGVGITQPTVTLGPDGSLYVAANNPGTPGAGPDGSSGPITSGTVTSFTPYGGVNWSTVIPAPVQGGPVLDTSGNVYVAAGGSVGQVIALNSSGAVLWDTTLGSSSGSGALRTAPLVTPGGSTVYVATSGSNGAVYALGTSDGAIVGTIGSGGTSGTLALSPRYGYFYAGTPDGLVTALPSGGGSAVWSAGTFSPESVNAAAIGADGTVYTSGGGTLLAVSGAAGATKWSFTAPSGTTLSSPAIGPDGSVYVTTLGTGSGANQLYAFELT